MLRRIFKPRLQYFSLMMNPATRQLDVTRPQIKNVLQKDVVWLCGLFIKKGYEIRIVGGAVRDMLLDREAKDIDLSTTATPVEMIEVFKENKVRYIETGLQHGTLTAHLDSKDFEVTTLRVDVESDGRHAKVEFTNDWRLDAERRDLTFNALSLDINGMLYDYYNGENDLMKKKVRFVGNAESRIREDYLRILRYFRFYGRIASDTRQHENVTLDVIKKLATGMTHLAVERIWVEVNKIIVGNFAPHLIRLMYELDVAENIGLPQFHEQNMQTFERVWSNARHVKISAITILVTLLKDVKEVEQFCTKWKLSNCERNLACFIVSHRFNEDLATDTLKPYQDLLVNLSNPKNIELIRENVRQLLYYHAKFTESEELDEWKIPKFPVTGGDLKELGIKPGPDFGKILGKLKTAWIESNFTLTKEFLMGQI